MPVQVGSPLLAKKILFKTVGLGCKVDGVCHMLDQIHRHRESLLFKKKAPPQTQAAMKMR